MRSLSVDAVNEETPYINKSANSSHREVNIDRDYYSL